MASPDPAGTPAAVVDRRRSLGQAGEQLAADRYVSDGYQVLARNWRCREGEIDLIARRGATIVFCEVKTRSSEAFGLPAEAVGHAKQQRVRRLAARWLQQEKPARAATIRFDVASVLRGQLEIMESAF